MPLSTFIGAKARFRSVDEAALVAPVNVSSRTPFAATNHVEEIGQRDVTGPFEKAAARIAPSKAAGRTFDSNLVSVELR